MIHLIKKDNQPMFHKEKEQSLNKKIEKEINKCFRN